MSAVARLSTPITKMATRRAFSTTTASLKPATTDAAASNLWAWKNLSPKTRRNVAYGLGACAVVDSYIVYNYFPGMLGLKEETKN
ncbi:hypothetical protein MAJ_00111, partial [Metarhizium majus ARSEF 297]